MKKIFSLLLILIGTQGFAQDTTAVRWIGVDPGVDSPQQFHYFKSDSTGLSAVSSSYGTGHAIFTGNADSLVYAILDPVYQSGDRNLYQINPFNGTITLVYDITATFSNSGDISEDGQTVYVISGNGDGTPGQITAVDLTTMTETMITTALNVPGESSFGMEFHPADSSLYVFEGSWSGNHRIQRINLLTLENVNEPLLGDVVSQIHGAKWTGVDSVFLVTTGWGTYLTVSDATSNNLTTVNSLPIRTVDIDEFYTLRREADTVGLCPYDSTLISSIYPFPSLEWYMDGVLLPETNDSIWVSVPGTYKALFPISGGNFMWSESIVIQNYTVPIVVITQAENDSLICDGEIITLTGASGGTLQWYLDGAIISGANSSTYDAEVIGSYNQMKTNISGCSDTADVAFIIYQDPDCPSGIIDHDLGVNVYPNPIEDDLTIESTSAIESVIIHDITGRLVYKNYSTNSFKEIINLEFLGKGLYLITIKTKDGNTTKTVFK